MSEEIYTGGSAFPFEEVRERLGGRTKKWYNHEGITKREHFASLAIQGFCANEKVIINDCNISEIVNLSLSLADKLLEKTK